VRGPRGGRAMKFNDAVFGLILLVLGALVLAVVRS
jgi:hypothetical protein